MPSYQTSIIKYQIHYCFIVNNHLQIGLYITNNIIRKQKNYNFLLKIMGIIMCRMCVGSPHILDSTLNACRCNNIYICEGMGK